jgi:hypothetical protein
VLDPLLAPALQLAELPVIPDRAWANRLAEKLVTELERLAPRIEGEKNPTAAGQLGNVAEVLGVSVLSLVAYSRGRTPRVASKAPENLNVVVADTMRRRQ